MFYRGEWVFKVFCFENWEGKPNPIFFYFLISDKFRRDGEVSLEVGYKIF